MKKLALLLFISITVTVIAFLSLPWVIDRLVLPSMLAKTPFSFSRASMNRITPYLVEGSVEIRDGEAPVVSIPRFQLRFTPQSLFNKTIASLVVDRATLHFRRENGRLLLPGFEAQTGTGREADSSALFFLPLGVEALILDQCFIVIHETGRPTIHIGVSGQLTPAFNVDGAAHRLNALHGSLFLTDDISAAVTAAATLGDEEIALELQIDNGALALPEGITGERPLPRFKSVSAELDLVADAATFAVKHYTLDGRLTGLRYVDDQIAISGGHADGSLNFSLSGTPDTHDYRLDGIALEAPVSLQASVAGEARRRPGQVRTSGTVAAEVRPTEPVESDTIPLTLSFDGIWSAASGSSLMIEGGCASRLDVRLGDDWSLTGLAGLQVSGSLESAGQQLQAELRITSGPLQIDRRPHRLTTSDLDIEARLTSSPDRSELRITGALDEISLPGQELSARNIVFDLPLSPVPASDAPHSGSLSIETVEMRNEHLFSLAADLTSRARTYRIDGAVEMFRSGDFRLPFYGRLDWPGRRGAVAWDLVTGTIEPALLPAFLPLPADLDFSGRLEARGSISYDQRLQVRAQAAVRDARLDFSGLVVEDLNCAIEFPELPRLQSSPSQLCTAAELAVSTLQFSDISLTYRVEDPRTLFIERSRLTWCGGRLESGSLRLSSRLPEIDTTFYCSRIGLAELLAQFGFKGTEGEGTLNGKLPVKLSRERLDFDDGFLFSTPGTGGIVRFSDTDLLRQGVGAVSEAGFLNYTLQALEDFTYNWTKLSFNSEGDDLLLTLELDGTPSTALPFAFDGNGMLVESDQGQGLQYPIRLDVNFRVPLTDLFQVGQSLNTIMGSGQ